MTDLQGPSAADGVLPLQDRRTLDERVYDHLRLAIMQGAFQPGERLTLRGLASAMGTSLSPVRNAVARLAVEQALEALPNRSIHIPVLSSEQFDELTQIRLALEPLASRLAATRLDDEGLEALRALNARMTRSTPSEYLKLNADFHFTIYEAARRPMLKRLISGTWLRAGPLLRSLETTREDLPTKEHHRVIDALARRDPEAAAGAMADDIRDAAASLQMLIRARS